MGDVVRAFNETQVGQILMVIITILLFALVFYVVSKLMPVIKLLALRLKSFFGRNGPQFEGGGKAVEADEKPPDSTPRICTWEVHQNRVASLVTQSRAATTTFYEKRDLIEEKSAIIYEKQLATALKNAVEVIKATYPLDKAKSNIVSANFLLEVYLRHDFVFWIKDQIASLKSLSDIGNWTDLDVNEKVQELTNSCLTFMSNASKKYLIIESELLLKTFQNKTPEIKETLIQTIKTLVKSARTKQNDLELAVAALEQTLKELIERESQR